MGRNDNIRGPKTRKTLELVLKLLLDLAGHKQNFWSLVEAQIKARNVPSSQLAKLQNALIAEWVNPQNSDNPLTWLMVTSKYHQMDNQLYRSSEVMVTKIAVHQCLKYLNYKNLKVGTNVINVEDVLNALSLLQNLRQGELSVNLLKGDSQGQGHWHFALNFTDYKNLGNQACITYVLGEANKKYPLKDRPDPDLHARAAYRSNCFSSGTWVDNHLENWRKSFFNIFEKYQLIYVPLRLETETPQPETLPEKKQCDESDTYLSDYIKSERSTSNRRLIHIEGEAGSGKTSLLVEIARLLMDQNLLPILLEAPKDKSLDIVETVRSLLANVDREISYSGAQELLDAGKLVLFIDQYSELNKDEQEWYSRKLADLSDGFIVIGSRSHLPENFFSYWDKSKIKTTRIKSDKYTKFFTDWLEKLRILRPSPSFPEQPTSTNAYPHIIATILEQIAPGESTVLFALLAAKFYFDYHDKDVQCTIVSAQLDKLRLGSSFIRSWRNLAFEYADKCLYSSKRHRGHKLTEPTFEALQNLAFEAFSHNDTYSSQPFSQDLLDQYFGVGLTQTGLHESDLIQSSLIQKEYGTFKFAFSSFSNLLASHGVIMKYKSDNGKTKKTNLDAPGRVKEFVESLINKSATNVLISSFIQALRLCCLDEISENITWLEVANIIHTYLERKHYLQESDTGNTRNNLDRHKKYRTFIGRREELGKLIEMLSHPNDYPERRIFIKGIGGAGKTTLAIEAASSLIKPSIGVYSAIYFATASPNATYTPEPETTFNNLKDLLAGMLAFCKDELNMSSFEDNKIKLKEYLESGNTKTLIILDNFEDIGKEEAEEIIKYFASIRKSGYKLLITTREAVFAEIELRGLMREDSMNLIDELLGRYSPDLVNNISLDAALRAKIIEVADSIPLAIEYIIRWLVMGEPFDRVELMVKDAKGEVCKRLHDNVFEKIKAENPECLSLLYALTFAPDSFEEETLLDIANASAQTSKLQDNLNMLHRFSWVISRNRPISGFKCYSFISSLTRGYIQQALSKDDVHKASRVSWIDCYVKKAQEYGNDDYGNWHKKFDRISEDWDNFVAVFEWCQKNWGKGEEMDEYYYLQAKKLWRSLQRFFYLYPNFETRSLWSENLEDAAKKKGDQEIMPELCISKAWLILMKDCKTDIEAAAKSLYLALGSSQISVFSKIEAHINLGVCRTRLGDFLQADNFFTKANDYCESLKQSPDENYGNNELRIKRAQLRILLYSGERFYREKNYAKAQELYEKVDEGAKEIDWLRFRIKANERLAFLEILHNNLTEAQLRLEEWIEFAKNNKDDRRIAFFHRDFAELYFRQEKFREAEDYAMSAEAAFRRLNMSRRVEDMRELRGRVIGRKNRRLMNPI
jgi:thymidylate kinase